MTFRVYLKEDFFEFQKKLLTAIGEKVNKAVLRALPEIKRQVAQSTGEIFRNTETYRSLSDGRLAGHFGFHIGNGKKKAEAVIRAVENSIQTRFLRITPRGRYFDGGLKLFMVKSDLSEILNISEAIVITPENGHALPWLEWLLLEGDRIIISDHVFNPRTGSGRSTQGFMMKNSGVWRVPPEYSGTIRDNWLTRVFLRDRQRIADRYGEIIHREISRVLR